MTTTTTNQPPKGNRLLILSVAAIFFVGIFIFWLCAVGGDWPKELESLFSGWAFVGLIAAVFLQSEELRMQQHELKQTTLALERAAKAQEDSEVALKRQNESTDLSSLISAYSSILQFYDFHPRQNNESDTSHARHALKQLKELVDHLDHKQGRWPQNRPDGWRVL